MKNLMQALSSCTEHGEAVHNNADEQGESSSQQQRYAQSAIDQQQESGAQASDIQSNQQQKSNVQATRDQASQTESDYYGECMVVVERNSKGEKGRTKNIGPEVPAMSFNISNDLNKDPDLITLGDALKLFRLPEQLQKLDSSLEKVRRHIKDKEQHEDYLKGVDKNIQKLSLKYHPDKVKSRGGSDEELAQAQKMQTILNATRSVLNSLTRAFLENLDIDYKYEFYAKIEINLLGNEDEIKKLNLQVLHNLVMLSEIKQKIIAQINKFLNASNKSIESFTKDNVTDFEEHRNNALLYLSTCIDGYNELSEEFYEVKKEFKEDKELEIMSSLINRMAKEICMQLNTLIELEQFAKSSLTGRFQIFTNCENEDKYFVLPFVKYINVLLMCSKVCSKEKNNGVWQYIKKFITKTHEIKIREQDLKQEEERYVDAYHLASYFNGNTKYDENELRNVLEIAGDEEISVENVKNKFNEVIRNIKDDLEKKFKPDDYIEGGTKKYIMKEYAKWMRIMDEFLKKEEKFIEDTWNEIINSHIEKERIKEECNEDIEENRKIKEDIRSFMQEMSSYMKHEETSQDKANY
ncbi:uncharacterized protein LOC114882126 isoform X2 [Osmia bicornis bicornis]|nr:uncharacterized protein LOC114882126 isoform X2 [Osmia bicornis bicornis]